MASMTLKRHSNLELGELIETLERAKVDYPNHHLPKESSIERKIPTAATALAKVGLVHRLT